MSEASRPGAGITRESAPWPIPAEDPYGTLARLRAEGPIHRLERLDGWMVVTHAEAHRILRSDTWSSDPSRAPVAAARMGLDRPGASDVLGGNVLFSDGEQHHRLRGALAGWLTPRAVASLQGRIAAVVEAVLAAHDPGEPWDVMDEIAYPVPLAVICELLNAGVELAERLRDETQTLTALVDPMATPSQIEAGLAAATVLTFDVLALVADRRAVPADDLVSALAGVLEPEEAIAMTLLVLAAGHETTANLIGNAVIALHDHPELIHTLRHDPDLVPVAVEELLRWESPVQLTARVATCSQLVGPAEIAEGDQVFVSLGGANRDPQAFERPDELALGRRGLPHLAFGHGAHFCAGASLARSEAAEVLRALIRLDPPLEERGLDYRRGSSATFRRIESLTLSR